MPVTVLSLALTECCIDAKLIFISSQDSSALMQCIRVAKHIALTRSLPNMQYRVAEGLPRTAKHVVSRKSRYQLSE